MRIGVDCDGVMYPFTQSIYGWCDMIGFWEENGLERPGPGHEWSNWNGYRDLGITDDQFLTLCEEGVDAGYIFRYGEPYDDCVKVLRQLRDDGHTIHIITHRTFGKKSTHNTIDWLLDYNIEWDTITFAEDKTIVGVDLLVDDRDKNYWQSIEQGIPCVIMSRPWNSHVQDAPRVADWIEFYDYVQGFMA